MARHSAGRWLICWFPSCLLLLAFVGAAAADPKPLSKEEQAKVDKAIEKGIAYLKREQTKEGNWPTHWGKRFLVGECALPAYALLEAGVPGNDPVIQKAAAFIRPKVANTDDTYQLSLAVLFFDRLGDPKDEKLIQTCALRLIAGQFYSGGWSYVCPRFKVGQDLALLKVLEALSEQRQEKKSLKAAFKALANPASVLIWPLQAPCSVPWSGEVLEDYKDYRRGTREHKLPPSLKGFKGLAVFQDPEMLTWREVGFDAKNMNNPDSVPLVGLTDNSNTQFAMLALWVAQRHGIPTKATFRLLAARFDRAEVGMYRLSKKDLGWSNGSMICVDLLGLAIGQGLKFSGSGSSIPRGDLRVIARLAALYATIGSPRGQMDKPLPPEDVYFLWSLERVGMLFNLPTLGDKEWYRWGAEILVANQLDSGEFSAVNWWKKLGFALPRKEQLTYGPCVSSAFALLFLKHSHPMKELTPNLPFTARELNEGITRLRSGSSQLQGSTTIPSRSTKPGP